MSFRLNQNISASFYPIVDLFFLFERSSQVSNVYSKYEVPPAVPPTRIFRQRYNKNSIFKFSKFLKKNQKVQKVLFLNCRGLTTAGLEKFEITKNRFFPFFQKINIHYVRQFVSKT